MKPKISTSNSGSFVFLTIYCRANLVLHWAVKFFFFRKFLTVNLTWNHQSRDGIIKMRKRMKIFMKSRKFDLVTVWLRRKIKLCVHEAEIGKWNIWKRYQIYTFAYTKKYPFTPHLIGCNEINFYCKFIDKPQHTEDGCEGKKVEKRKFGERALLGFLGVEKQGNDFWIRKRSLMTVG